MRRPHIRRIIRPCAETALFLVAGWLLAEGLWLLAILPILALEVLGALELQIWKRTAPQAQACAAGSDKSDDPLSPLLERCLASASDLVGVAAPPIKLRQDNPQSWSLCARAVHSGRKLELEVSLATTLLLAPTPERLTAILVHELSHVARHDLGRTLAILVGSIIGASVLGGLVVAAVFWIGGPLVGLPSAFLIALAFGPALRVIGVLSSGRQEDAADTNAARLCGAQVYAAALLSLEVQEALTRISAPEIDKLLAARPQGLAAWRVQPCFASHDPLSRLYLLSTEPRHLLARLRDPHRPCGERIGRLGINVRTAVALLLSNAS